MKNVIKSFFEKLICKHDYIVKKTIPIVITEDNKQEASALVCMKCGKQKIEIHY